MYFFVSVQGEDGFPGFKGDMGIKGDRVSVVGLGFGPGTSRVGLGICMKAWVFGNHREAYHKGGKHLCKILVWGQNVWSPGALCSALQPAPQAPLQSQGSSHLC